MNTICEINNVILRTENNNLFIEINSQSDIITTYVCIKFYLQKLDILNSIFVIKTSNKNLIIHHRENMFEMSKYTLNEFLLDYNNKLISKESDTNILDNDEYEAITGWQIIFTKPIKIITNDILFIEAKVDKFWDEEYRKKNIWN